MNASSVRRGLRAALIAVGCSLVLAAAPTGPAWADGAKKMSDREMIDTNVREALGQFHRTITNGSQLQAKAAGMLVFPHVIKAGVGVGGEYGEGALLIGGGTAGYYSIGSASIGFQLGVQVKSIVILFMNADALARFRASDGWKAGVDGSVALVTIGAGKAVDTESINKPIIGFIFSNKGLMYNLTLEGSKITKINR